MKRRDKLLTNLDENNQPTLEWIDNRENELNSIKSNLPRKKAEKITNEALASMGL